MHGMARQVAVTVEVSVASSSPSPTEAETGTEDKADEEGTLHARQLVKATLLPDEVDNGGADGNAASKAMQVRAAGPNKRRLTVATPTSAEKQSASATTASNGSIIVEALSNAALGVEDVEVGVGVCSPFLLFTDTSTCGTAAVLPSPFSFLVIVVDWTMTSFPKLTLRRLLRFVAASSTWSFLLLWL